MKVYINICLTVCLLVFGQIAVKYGASRLALRNQDVSGILKTVCSALLNPWIVSGMAAAFLSAVSWIFVLQQMELSRAYPFAALAFIFVPLCGAVFLQEPLSAGKLFGGALIFIGIIISARL